MLLPAKAGRPGETDQADAPAGSKPQLPQQATSPPLELPPVEPPAIQVKSRTGVVQTQNHGNRWQQFWKSNILGGLFFFSFCTPAQIQTTGASSSTVGHLKGIKKILESSLGAQGNRAYLQLILLLAHLHMPDSNPKRLGIFPSLVS